MIRLLPSFLTLARGRIMAAIALTLWLTGLMLAVNTLLPRQAAAQASFNTCWPRVCICPRAYAAETNRQISEEHNLTRWFFGEVETIPDGLGELGEHQRFLIRYLFRGDDNIGGILPAWMLMSQQLTAVMMQQMEIIGTFLDAKHQLETQQILRELTAKAHKTYHPSQSMCIFGTNTRSLAAADGLTRMNAAVLGQRGLQRLTGAAYVAAADGRVQDTESRLDHFKGFFCDYNDNNATTNPGTGYRLLCPEETGIPANQRRERIQTDIDYGRIVDLPRTLNVAFALPGPREPYNDERAVFELALNLYGSNVFNRLDDKDLSFIANHDDYQDMRSIIAKRSVVQNSFNHIVGMKARGSRREFSAGPGVGGSNDTAEYMAHFLSELGVLDATEQLNMLGDHASAVSDGTIVMPSYYAQMEVLAKRIYQDPSFFTNLYDTPANVRRKSAALQAIGLMLERDMYDSQLRAEMLMSQMLELRIVRAQRTAESRDALMAPTEERGP